MNVTRLWFADDRIYICQNDEKVLWQSLLWYPKLRSAKAEEREKYRLTVDGIRWDSLDEDVSFESFLYEHPEPTPLMQIFKEHPELKATAIAARLSIAQPLFSDYLRGKKKPSPKRLELIKAEIRKVGFELTQI